MKTTAISRIGDHGFDLVNKYCKTSDIILIVAADSGAEVKFLTEVGYKYVYGVDIVDVHNFVRSKRHIGEDFLEPLEPICHPALKPSGYDAVVCIGCFVPGALDERHVDDLVGTLKPGGISVIATLEMFVTDPGEQFNYPYNLKSKLEQLNQCGKLTLVEQLRVQDFSENCAGVVFVNRLNIP